MISFKEFFNATNKPISASGKYAEYHKRKYLDPYIGANCPTHIMHTSHGDLSEGTLVQLIIIEDIGGKYHAKILSEAGKTDTIPVSKLRKPGPKAKNKGFDFERHFNKHLKSNGLMSKNAKLVGYTHDTDFHIIDKRHPTNESGTRFNKLNGELKNDHKAAMGQLTIHHSKEKGWHVSDEAKARRPNYAKHVEKHIIPYMNEHHPDPKKQRKTESGRAESITVPHKNMEPAHAYLKDHHVDILHVGHGKGTYAVGKDKSGHGLPNISGKGLWTIRDKSNVPNARMVQFQPHGAHGLKPSHVNLEVQHHMNEFKKTMGH